MLSHFIIWKMASGAHQGLAGFNSLYIPQMHCGTSPWQRLGPFCICHRNQWGHDLVLGREDLRCTYMTHLGALCFAPRLIGSYNRPSLLGGSAPGSQVAEHGGHARHLDVIHLFGDSGAVLQRAAGPRSVGFNTSYRMLSPSNIWRIQ